jgi:polyisoprenoid-binding protein YceI
MKSSLKALLIFSTFTLTLPVLRGVEVDKAHSEIEFSVSHLVVSRTRGQFHDFTADVEVEDGKLKSASAVIQVDSIDTDNEKRDNHLKSADFFHAEEFPEITFTSTKVEEGKLHGNMTIRGVTKPVILDMEFKGPVKHPFMDKTVYGLNLSATIDRTEFGLTWNKALETGGVVVGDKVDINVSIELLQ